MLGRHGLETYVTPSESWDCSQMKKGEIIEERKFGNEIEDSREADLSLTEQSVVPISYSQALINAVVTVVYCIYNTRILTQRAFADAAHLCVCMCLLVLYGYVCKHVHLRKRCKSYTLKSI